MTIETPVVLSLDERRENFVRDRFGQKDVFGMETFEAYVDGISGASNLLGYPKNILRRLLCLMSDVMQPGNTMTYATPFFPEHLARIPLDWIERSEYMRTAAMTVFERVVPRDETHAYWGCMDLLALLDTPRANGNGTNHGALRAHPNSETLPDSPHEVLLQIGSSTKEIAEVIFAEWYRGWPKAEVARDHCIACLRECIRAERENAEHDFNTAVAVSADGRKIVHADEVWIGRYAFAHITGLLWEPNTTLPTSAFSDYKVLRIDGDLPRFDDDIAPLCAGADQIQQGLILNASGKRVFFTTKEFCPPELLA